MAAAASASASASASAVVEGFGHEKSAAKRKRIDSVEEMEHEITAAVEGVEHEQSAVTEGVEHEEAAAVEGVEHEQSAVTEGVEHEEAAAEEGVWGGVSIEEYLQYEFPYRPGIVCCRNDEELARFRQILEEDRANDPARYGYDSDCNSEDSDDMDDEFRLYKEQIDKSDGFDIDFAISKPFYGAIYPIDCFKGGVDYSGMVDTSIKFAIKNYNEQHQDHEKLEFLDVERANVKFLGGHIFYITFRAKNIATSKVKIYQAQVDYVFGDEKEFKVLIFREKAEN